MQKQLYKDKTDYSCDFRDKTVNYKQIYALESFVLAALLVLTNATEFRFTDQIYECRDETPTCRFAQHLNVPSTCCGKSLAMLIFPTWKTLLSFRIIL